METFEIIIGVVILLVIGILIYTKKNKVKSGIQNRIEKNAVKIPNISWRGKLNGEVVNLFNNRNRGLYS